MGGGKLLNHGDYSPFVCNRVTVCGTLPSLCSWLSCTDVTCSWLPCLGWWSPARCSSLGLWLATGLTAIPGTKVHVMVSLWFQKLHRSSVNRPPGASVSSWVMYSFFLLLVAHASLFIQNISVTVCSIVLMLVFLYKQRIEQIWDGWLTVSTPFPNGHVSSLVSSHWPVNNVEMHSSSCRCSLYPVCLLFLLLSLWLLCCHSNMLHRKTYTRWFVIRWWSSWQM